MNKPKQLPSLKRIWLVECARGAAATYVCLHHLVMIVGMADWFKWGKFVIYPLGFGQDAVYLFFFLSGFSIHYSSQHRPLDTFRGVSSYYYLRLRRIYPIFLFAIGLAIGLDAIISKLGIASQTMCHLNGVNIFFLLTFLTDYHPGSWQIGLANDQAFWSLSYEVPYYLLYPFFLSACKQFGVSRAFGGTFIISAIFTLVDVAHVNHISNVLALYWLWTAGALMAEWKLENKRFDLSPDIYYFVLFLCYAASQSLEAIAQPVISWNLKALVIGSVIFSAFVNFQPLKYSRRLLSAAGLLVALLISLLLTRHVPTWGRHVFLDARLVFAAVSLAGLHVIGTNIFLICRRLAAPFFKMGGISYALYVVHTPIIFFTTDVLRSAGVLPYWILLALLPIFWLAWWVEIKFQPSVAGWLDLMRAKLGTFFEKKKAARL